MSQRLNVLLVDEDVDHAKRLADQLENISTDEIVLEHERGIAPGLDRLNSGLFDVVLLDLSTTDPHALDDLSDAIERFPELPVIVLTGEDDPTLAREVVRRGAQDFLLKRYLDSTTLSASIQHALERNRYRRDQAQHIEELQSFTSTMVHELKASLGRTHAYVSFAQQGVVQQSPDSVSEMLRDAREQLESMELLLDRLWEYASMGPGSLGMPRVPLSPCAEDAVREMGAQIGESRAEVVVESLPVVRGDGLLLKHLFHNLIGNALSHSMSDRPTIRIRGVPDEQDVIEVLDNGVGIPEDELREVFQEFSRTSRHATQGHGLGLAICRRIVEQHGGVIWAESGEGGGASIRFTLPIA